MKPMFACLFVFSLFVLAGCDKSVDAPAKAPDPIALSAPKAKAEVILKDEFIGEWDGAAAKLIAERQLERVVWVGKDVGCEGSCDIRHDVTATFDMNSSGTPAKYLLIASNDPINSCHACAPAISLLMFRKSAQGWVLSNSELAFTHWGSNGSFSGDQPASPQLVNLNQDQIALLLSLTDGHQGFQQTTHVIYVNADGKMREAFKGATGEDFSGVNSDPKNLGTVWSSVVSIETTGNQPTLIIKSSGKKAAKALSLEKRLSFDGKKFVAVRKS